MKPTVLVVDDDKGIGQVLREVLELEGYTVLTAVHGGLALEQLRASPEPLLVLLGLCMPDVDGEQVLEAVAAHPALASRHRLVVVTGSVWWATSGRVAVLREQLDVPLVPKPFTVQQVLDAVEAASAKMG